MIKAITFSNDNMDVISFQAEIEMENGKIYYADVPQDKFTGDGIMRLTAAEARQRNIDLTHMHESSMIPVWSEIPHENEVFQPIVPPMPIETGRKTPKNSQLIPEPLTAPKIFSPSPINREKYLTESSSGQSKLKLNGASIYRFLKTYYQIRLYDEKVYVFEKDEGIYKLYSDNALDFLINKHFGNEIANANLLNVYYDAKDFLKRDFELAIREENQLPVNYWSFKNGFLNINTGKLIENDGRYFVCSVLKCNYNPTATCPAFDAYINSLAGNDPCIIKLVWQVIGYLLSRDTNAKSFFTFIGKKDTGKSLLANIITRIVGKESVSNLSVSDLAGRFDVSNLKGKHLNICMDLPDKKLSVETVGKIKMITGKDTIYSDVKYKDPIAFIATARLIFGSNSNIRTELPDRAFDERQVTIPFNYPIPKDQQDVNLEDKLVLEAEGICRKAIEYYKELQSNHYQFIHMTYLDENDSSINYDMVLHDFSNECCMFTQSDEDKIATSQLHTLFGNYCHSKCISSLDLNSFSRKFSDIFKDKIEKKRARIGTMNVQAFCRIKLKKQAE